MRTSAFCQMVGCVLLSLPVVSPAADATSAMFYADGAAWLNGAHVPNSSAIFAGDLVQTRSDSAASIHAPGSTVTVHGDSVVKFEGSAFDIEHGGVSVSTSKAMGAKAGEVKITPSSNSWTEFNVTDLDGEVRIAALKGDLTISDENGSVKLPQGNQTTRDESGSSGSSKDSRKKKSRNPASGAPAAGIGGALDSKLAIGIGSGIIAAGTTWVLVHSDNPISPEKPQ